MLILTEADVERLLDLDALPDAIETALRAVIDGSASVPPRAAAYSGLGLLGAMPGYVPGLGLGAKLVTYFPRNHERGLPGHQAVVLMVDPDDGRLLALMGGTHITAVRTAAAAVVAAHAVAGEDVRAVTVVGTGVQARAHLDAFGRRYPTTRRRVTGRSADRVARVAAERSGVEPVLDVERAVRDADVVCLCTDSPEPVISLDWLRAGSHVSSVGSGVEVDSATIAAAAVFVESRLVATQPFPTGSRELEGRDPDTLTEIGEVLLGLRPGRHSQSELTVYKSMGHASEDVAAAALVLSAAQARGIGSSTSL